MYNLKDVYDTILINAKIKTSYLSLYQHTRVIDDNLTEESTVVDKVLIEMRELSKCKVVHEALIRLGLRHFIAYSGEGYYIFVVCNEFPLSTGDPKLVIDRWRKKELEKEILVNVQVNVDLNKKVIIPNTYNTRARRYCVALKYEEIYLSQEEINKIAENNRQKVHVPETDKLHNLSLDEYL